MHVPAAKKARLIIKCSDNEKLFILKGHLEYLYRLGSIKDIEMGPDCEKPEQSAAAVLTDMEIYMPLGGLIDIENEKARLIKDQERIESQIVSINKKLRNSEFIRKAPPDVVTRERDKLKTFTENLDKLKSNLNSLGV